MKLRLFTVFVLACCTACASAQTPAEMAPYGAALNKVARAVDAGANNPAFSALNGDELLAASTRHDQSLLTPFSGFRLKARRIGGSSAVLMCDADEKRALLEDSGCTLPLDAHRYQRNDACEFVLPIEQLCK